MGTRIRVFIFKILNRLIKIKLFMSLYNFLFERSSNRIFDILTHIKLPNKTFIWNIRLVNKKSIKTIIYKENLKTWQFALSYKWHEPSLNLFEKYIAYYIKEKNNVIWVDFGANLGLRSLTALSEGFTVLTIKPNEELNALNRAL